MINDSLRESLKVYFIMGSANTNADPRHILTEAIEGGITLFQYREKGAGALMGDEKIQLATDLRDICKKKQIPFIVNDDIELALALDGDGVHIGQEDEDVRSVRERIGKKVLGVSVHTMQEAKSALQDGADYFGIGPIFPTVTKEDAKPSRGTILIEELRENGWDIPIVGIGGISASNASAVIAAGGDGISVITAISQATSPREAARALRIEMERSKKSI